MKQQQGIALILVLLVISLLSVLVIEFSYVSRVESSIAGNWINERRAYFLAKGGVNLGIALLEADKPEVDSFADAWAEELPAFSVEKGVVQVKVVDEDRFLNVNRLFEKDELSGKLTDALIRLACFYGVEKPGLTVGAMIEDLTENGRFDSKNELEGYPDLSEIVEFLTIYSPGKININTAPYSVLTCLSDDIGVELAQAVVEHRTQHPFRSVGEIGNVAGITGSIMKDITPVAAVKSKFFTVQSTVVLEETSRSAVAVVERTKEGPVIVYWR